MFDPKLPSHYRPINFSNVLYNIIAKVLSNRLKQVMIEIISLIQLAFLIGRLISDNILITHELLYHMRHHKTRDKHMAIKIDLSKAYDRVELKKLDYLIHLMGKLGFST